MEIPGGMPKPLAILLVSSGIDYFHGNIPESPDLQSAYERAQKQNADEGKDFDAAPDAEQHQCGDCGKLTHTHPFCDIHMTPA